MHAATTTIPNVVAILCELRRGVVKRILCSIGPLYRAPSELAPTRSSAVASGTLQLVSGSTSNTRRRSRRVLVSGSVLFAIVAGCSTAPAPHATQTTAVYTHAQVLGWVTPTLDNGFSFVQSAAPNASVEQMFAASRPLSTASSVSLHELARIPWQGPLEPKEKALVKALAALETLTTRTPGLAYVSQLKADIRMTQGALEALHRAVSD